MSTIFDTIVDKFNESKDDWVKISAGIVVVGATIYVGRKLLSTPPSAESPTLTKVDLMAHEKVAMQMMPAVTTITKFDHNGISPEPYLRSKMADILRKNAWLSGRLRSDDADGIYLAYEPIHTKTSDNEVAAIVREHFEVIDDFELPEGASYDELRNRLDHLRAKNGSECVNKPNEVLFKVFLVNMKGRNEVMLVFSLSHTIADGFTFYALQNMLDQNTPVSTLEVVRSTRYESEIRKLKGGEENMGPLAILGMIGCSVLRPTMKMHILKVDAAWIEAQKADFIARKSSLRSDQIVDFVSTNDILTAWHNRISRTDLHIMAVDCRKRVASFKSHQAGNYENHIVYNTPEDGNSPEAVRRSLQTFRNASRTLPDAWKLLSWNASMATNWCSFYKQIDISDAASGSKCTHKLHLPMTKRKDSRLFREGICIFNLDATTTGLLVLTRSLTPEVLESFGIGKLVTGF